MLVVVVRPVLPSGNTLHKSQLGSLAEVTSKSHHGLTSKANFTQLLTDA